MKEDTVVLELAIEKLSEAFNEFISECMDGNEPKAPSYRAIMKARGYLPVTCDKSLIKK